jgi:hypothetical protein
MTMIRSGIRRQPKVLGQFIAVKAKSKYGAVKVSVGGVKFDSKAEARRYGELVLLERAGKICDLRRQVTFALVPGVKFAGAARARGAIRYIADFVYIEPAGQVIEDVKGIETPEFKLKRHLLLALHGLEVRVTK